MPFPRLFKPLLLAAGLFSVVLLQGCATSIKASSSTNPPPAEAFSRFGRIELKPAVFAPGCNCEELHLKRVTANLDKNLAPSLKRWNEGPANGRTLIIEPVVDEMTVRSPATRLLLGPVGGSSGVLMHLNIHDADGKQVANPEFFQQAGAWAAAYAMGVVDGTMITRVSAKASNYLIANYETATSIPTGYNEIAPIERPKKE